MAAFPYHVGELVSGALCARRVAVRADEHAEPKRRQIEPWLNRKERAMKDLAIGLHFAHHGDNAFERLLDGACLRRTDDERELGDRHARHDLSLQDSEHGFRQPDPGFKHVDVRILAVADHEDIRFQHALRYEAMKIERNADGRALRHQLHDALDDLALRVVFALHRHGAVEGKQHRVELSGLLEAGFHVGHQEFEGFPGHDAARKRAGRDERNGLDTRGFQHRQDSRNLDAGLLQLGEHLVATPQVDGFERLQRRRSRREGVGFLEYRTYCDAHWP